MKKSVFLITLILLCTIFFTGCVFNEQGDSLQGFINRLNTYDDSYNITANGFIIDSNNKSLTRFFKFSEEEIMLTLITDDSNKITAVHMVMPIKMSDSAFTFVNNCIKAFCGDEAAGELMENSDFSQAISKIQNETNSTTLNGVTMEIDTTALGTVVSIYKDK